MSETFPLLETKGLTCKTVAPVDLRLAPGECIAITAPSGTGKSLFLRAIADLDPNTGEVFLNGSPRSGVEAPAWRHKVMYVPTTSGWWADTVAAHFHDWSAVAPQAKRMSLPDDVGEWGVDRLSTGERQRLSLLRALEHSPPVLLLDEPTSGLDHAATEAVEGLVAEHLANGGAIILTTHDTAQAQRLGTRHLTIVDGRLIEREAAA